jgi:hypothetical protein
MCSSCCQLIPGLLHHTALSARATRSSSVRYGNLSRVRYLYQPACVSNACMKQGEMASHRSASPFDKASMSSPDSNLPVVVRTGGAWLTAGLVAGWCVPANCVRRREPSDTGQEVCVLAAI